MWWHECPGECGRSVPHRYYACRACWFRLPVDLRDRISHTKGRNMAAHAQAMAVARQWLIDHAEVGK